MQLNYCNEVGRGRSYFMTYTTVCDPQQTGDKVLTMSSQARRPKTETPSMQKDELYWEKRNRNNIAAKKSRENKRQFENTIRSKVFALEKENILLRRELALIRSRFSIPENQSVFPLECQEECLKMTEDLQRSITTASSSPDTSMSQSPYHYDSVKGEPICSELDSTQREMDDTRSQTHAHAHRNSHPSRGFFIRELVDEDVHMYCSGLKLVPNAYSRRSSTYSDDNYEVTDLSMKRKRLSVGEYETQDSYKRNNSKDSDRLVTGESGDYSERVKYIAEARKQTKEQANMNEMTARNEDLRYKLESLSEQVYTMYKIVYNSD